MKEEKNKILQRLVIVIPFVVALVGIVIDQVWVSALMMISSVLVVKLPMCNKRESQYAFAITAIYSLPFNVFVGFYLGHVAHTEFSMGKAFSIILIPFICYIFFFAEEIIICYLTRLIWSRQYSVTFSRFNKKTCL